MSKLAADREGGVYCPAHPLRTIVRGTAAGEVCELTQPQETVLRALLGATVPDQDGKDLARALGDSVMDDARETFEQPMEERHDRQ